MTQENTTPVRQYATYYGTSLLFLLTFTGFLYFDAMERKWTENPFMYEPHFSGYETKKNNITEFETIDGVKHRVDSFKPKHVLFWNTPSFMRRNLFEGCDYRCILSTDKSKIKQQDAVLFHVPSMGGTPPPKPRGQVWIYFGVEPPSIYAANFKNWGRRFNWTINYRRDSDVISRYGSFGSRHLKSTNKNATRTGELSSQKNRTATWFVGNCNTHGRREVYVKVLKKHMDISIYGRCGNLQCRDSTTWGLSCLKKVEVDTRYYLSFENSLCRDYMTEKAYKVFKSDSLVPVVRGGANYSLYLPPNTFIDAAMYRDATALSKHLISIKNNKTVFTNLFMNRNIHNLAVNDNWGTKPFCELCRRLHFSEKYKRLYEDVSMWFRGTKTQPMCKQPTDLT